MMSALLFGVLHDLICFKASLFSYLYLLPLTSYLLPLTSYLLPLKAISPEMLSHTLSSPSKSIALI